MTVEHCTPSAVSVRFMTRLAGEDMLELQKLLNTRVSARLVPTVRSYKVRNLL